MAAFAINNLFSVLIGAEQCNCNSKKNQKYIIRIGPIIIGTCINVGQFSNFGSFYDISKWSVYTCFIKFGSRCVLSFGPRPPCHRTL